jgi:excisionase family DNA binding protein
METQIRLFGLREVAERLRLAESTVRQLVRLKKLQAVRIGRRLVVEEAALQAFIAERRTEVRG